MINALLFLISLPLAVYTYAGLFLLIDQSNHFRAVLHLTFRLVLLVGLLAVSPVSSHLWIGLAFGLVFVLHLVSQLALRYVVMSGRWPTQRVD